ncbi:MAG: MltR family transcriptional regulator [Armatimonas sp.]
MDSNIIAQMKAAIEVRKTLTEESDRGCVIIAASYIDSRLEDLLCRRFINNKKLVESIMQNSGPLGSFSSRIDMCFALGLLSEGIHKDLHLVRRIRNEFAHKFEPISFEDNPISSRCNEFSTPNIKDFNPRHKFTRTAMNILAYIDSKIFKSEHIEIPDDNINNELQFQMEQIHNELSNDVIKKSKDRLSKCKNSNEFRNLMKELIMEELSNEKYNGSPEHQLLRNMYGMFVP